MPKDKYVPQEQGVSVATFDVFINPERSSDDSDEIFDRFRARDWDVSESLSPQGIRRVTKTLPDHYSLQNELRPILGNDMQLNLVGGDDMLGDLIRGLSQQPADPEGPPKAVVVPRSDAASSEGPADKPKTNGGEPSPPAPGSKGDAAQLVHAGLGALTVPTKVWGYVGANNLPGLALPTVQSLYRERAAYARAVAWAVAPEVQLLDQALRGSVLAKGILETRTGISEEQIALRNQDVALRIEDVHLKRQAVAQQHEVALLLGEFRRQIQKWTWLADWGLALLILTLSFAIAMTVWVVHLASANKITAWALPAVIFTLAVFAISPAVLLLRERPLKGMDEWKPDAKAAGDAAPGADTSSASGGTTPAATAGASSATKSATAPG